MSDANQFEAAVRARAGEHCELCGAAEGLAVYPVPPVDERELEPERAVLLCATCLGQIEGSAALDAKHWFCLQQAAWSEHPAVQVVSYRLLGRLTDQEQGWASDLLEQLYLSDETLSWARAGTKAGPGGEGGEQARPRVVDSNGAELVDGDSVTLIKDLEVKGAGFTAKRGTLVKGIRLTDNPEHVDGRVNKVAIVLKTCFLKKVV